jgi:hypothetical protein
MYHETQQSLIALEMKALMELGPQYGELTKRTLEYLVAREKSIQLARDQTVSLLQQLVAFAGHRKPRRTPRRRPIRPLRRRGNERSRSRKRAAPATRRRRCPTLHCAPFVSLSRLQVAARP